ncbi:NTP transferase domain-containing protein [Altererythrobacter aurantiacus]|uniref:NTP transferase domain-containing protein n=1 Tax=Parapontixanthobacter aurantiacus TaxID=1463599 RepID=A0A844ZIZ0_9SPHN|nr:sugar phosphate nucleotidyltransferase [Parapontixanthobacter aurantiacus]MXO86960.1 NTP transferase domain-containing protein [Parapontixanthobacter aurantiacus]
MSLIHPVILCGGGGTRLWPRSRIAAPKPFLPLVGERTLFQQSLERTRDPSLFAPPIVVAGEAHQQFVMEQAGEEARLIVEPAARNTAPAIALAAARLEPEDIMLVCPSDHHIGDGAAFRAGVAKARDLAAEGWLVAFGVAPTRPETGYGYIKTGEPLGEGHRIERFVEKPDAERAETFLAEGGYIWNGGIFAFAAGRYLEELQRTRPEMASAALRAVEEGRSEGRVFYPAGEPFAQITGESVDYAVMEHTDRAATVSADMGWSDIGNWDALAEARDSDGDGNHARGQADLVDCRNVMVESDGPRVSIVGACDLIVVVDKGEVLVTTREGAQKVGKLPGAADQ